MRSLTLFALFFCSWSLSAQTPEDSVKSVVQQLFRGMWEADGALVRAVFTDSAILQTIRVNGEGSARIITETADDFRVQVSNMKKGMADERIRFEILQVDGPLATVWTTYQFYYQGQFSHCGVNSFQLVRGLQGWKIQYLIDTRRRQGCQ